MITEYNNLIEKIVKEFVKRYYEEIYNEIDVDYEYDYRIIPYQGINQGPVEISDEYYSIDDILITELYQIPLKIVQKHYNLGYEASLNNKRLGINLYNFWRREKDIELYNKEEKESLKKTEVKVQQAKKLLEESIKNFK